MATNFSENRIRRIKIGDIIYTIKGNNFCATSEEWQEKSSYVPAAGEIVIFSGERNRIKIGDGATPVVNLRFWDEDLFSDTFILDCGTSTINI